MNMKDISLPGVGVMINTIWEIKIDRHFPDKSEDKSTCIYGYDLALTQQLRDVSNLHRTEQRTGVFGKMHFLTHPELNPIFWWAITQHKNGDVTVRTWDNIMPSSGFAGLLMNECYARSVATVSSYSELLQALETAANHMLFLCKEHYAAVGKGLGMKLHATYTHDENGIRPGL